MIEVVELGAEKGTLAREILSSLPEWFGIPEAVDAYVQAADDLPMLAAQAPDRAFVGFISIKIHTPFAAEAYALAIKRNWHRQGVGRLLVEAAESRLTAQGISYLTVKTLAESRPDRHYAGTRRFYEAMGFLPLELLPTLWGNSQSLLADAQATPLRLTASRYSEGTILRCVSPLWAGCGVGIFRCSMSGYRGRT